MAGLARAAITSAKQADQRAEELVALIDGIRQAGATTLQSIADALNARGILKQSIDGVEKAKGETKNEPRTSPR